MKTSIAALLTGLVTSALAADAYASEYPNRSVRLVPIGRKHQ